MLALDSFLICRHGEVTTMVVRVPECPPLSQGSSSRLDSSDSPFYDREANHHEIVSILQRPNWMLRTRRNWGRQEKDVRPPETEAKSSERDDGIEDKEAGGFDESDMEDGRT